MLVASRRRRNVANSSALNGLPCVGTAVQADQQMSIAPLVAAAAPARRRHKWKMPSSNDRHSTPPAFAGAKDDRDGQWKKIFERYEPHEPHVAQTLH